jgi:hypothetical protein
MGWNCVLLLNQLVRSTLLEKKRAPQSARQFSIQLFCPPLNGAGL